MKTPTNATKTSTAGKAAKPSSAAKAKKPSHDAKARKPAAGPTASAPALIPLPPLSDAAECLRIMAHPLRLRIVDILMQGDFPVHEIAQMCGLPPHQTSEHLRLMKGHGFLDAVRHSRIVYYRIANPRLPRLLECLRATCPPGAAVPKK